MKKIRNLMTILLISFMISSNTFASAKKYIYEPEIDGTNISLTDTSSSETYINVIREINGVRTTIYSGAVSGYENGLYSELDFSLIGSLTIYNMNNVGEAIFIIPSLSSSITNTPMSGINFNTINGNNTVSISSSLTVSSITTNMSLMYNGKYCENVLLPGQTLNVPISITNSGDTAVELSAYIACYDLSGRLTDITKGEPITAFSNTTVTSILSCELDSDATHTAKIFLWQKNNLKPVSNSIYLTLQTQDYYSDTYENANIVDIENNICGIINTFEDVDIVKYTPSVTGIYALNLSATGETVCALYDNEQTLLNSVSAVEDKNYLLYNLVANIDYFIRFSGDIDSSYEITSVKPDEIESVIKNMGVGGIITDAGDFDVYKFIPSKSGDYIITAVDSSGVTAQLYNSDYEKIGFEDEPDSMVSFRIISNMVSNQEYYIIVYPKFGTLSDTYELYVEEPFALIAVE